MTDRRPLIAHVVYGFHTGGLENGLVNLINRLPPERFRHAVISLTSSAAAMRARIERDDVVFADLNKGPGHAIGIYPVLRRLFVELAPALVHTRNLAALEAVVPAWLAGVPARVHGEHGWDTDDPNGTRRKYRLVRRLYRPFVNQYVALSRHLAGYLSAAVGVPEARIVHICNGVDTRRFAPACEGRELLPDSPFNASKLRVIGTVGRQQAIKDPLNLLHAFAALRRRLPEHSANLRLMMVGDGPLRDQLARDAAALGLEEVVWLAGERGDVPAVMRAMDLFVLPSRAEGISNTVLEAMASGLPVVATDVGGNPELVAPGTSGALAPPADSEALADVLAEYVVEPERMARHGRAARERAVARFSIDGMVACYAELYEQQLSRSGQRQRAAA